MSTHSSADKLRDLHAESLRYNIPCCTAALALPEIAADRRLDSALAALSARLGGAS